jgi:hypothetical protein
MILSNKPRLLGARLNLRRITAFPVSAMRRILGRKNTSEPVPPDFGHWLAVLRTIGGKVISDHATMTAAGLAFHSLLGIVPILVVVTALHGLIADPAAVQNPVEGLRGFCRGRLRTSCPAV